MMLPAILIFIVGILHFQHVATESTANATATTTNNGKEESVVYSYSEAVIGSDGKPSVSQLIITKGSNDSDYHYVNSSSNGATETGKWEGPLPKVPELNMGDLFSKQVSNNTSKPNNTNFADYLSVLSQSITTSIQDYMKNAFNH